MRRKAVQVLVMALVIVVTVGLCAAIAAETITANGLVTTLTSKVEADKDGKVRDYYKAAQESGKLTEATTDLEKLSLKYPKDISVQRAVAEGYTKQRDWDKVVSIYEALVKANPDDGMLSGRLLNYYILQKNYTPVIEKLEPIVKDNPNDTQNINILLKAYVGAGRVTEAVNLYEQRLKEEPGSPGLLGSYARALMDFGKTAEAAKIWEKAAVADPNNLHFKQKLAECYEALGQQGKAQKEYQAIVKQATPKQSGLKDAAQSKLKK